MLRRVVVQSSPLIAVHDDHQQRRFMRMSSINETFRPAAGTSAGQLSIMNEIAVNGDAEEERRKPLWRMEVYPKRRSASYLHTMYQWGYNSLTLFRRLNEDTGPWWNANSATVVSTWNQLGDMANAGMWSGVWRYTYGIGNYNMRPYETFSRAFGRKDKKSGAVTIDYEDSFAKSPTQKLMFPHTKEHVTHRRIKNPALPGFVDVDGLHGKRILREVQYHLGQGLRFYLVDGVFGTCPATATPYRILTDNATSAYFASMASVRKFNYVSREESVLTKRLSQSPIDEWGWRRPGVVVYHTPSYDFEAPRIVEEFGGPRPQDLSLKTPKFVALEPYSIPMKGIVSAEPRCETLLETVGFLCARWGFYADDAKLVTLQGDSVLSKDGKSLTLVIGDTTNALKASRYLYGAHHHRLNGAFVARAWDVNSVPSDKAETGPRDLVETSLGKVHKPLPTRVGCSTAISHRYFNRRHVTDFGYKFPHNYTDDAATRADQGGHLFGGAAKNTLSAFAVRPAAVATSSVDVVVIGGAADATDAAKVIVELLKESGFLYAEADKLSAAVADVLSKVRSVKIVPKESAAGVLETLSATGAL